MAIKVETEIKSESGLYFLVGDDIYPGSLYHRQDRYENGSCVDSYGIEINKDNFVELRGDLLAKKRYLARHCEAESW